MRFFTGEICVVFFGGETTRNTQFKTFSSPDEPEFEVLGGRLEEVFGIVIFLRKISRRVCFCILFLYDLCLTRLMENIDGII